MQISHAQMASFRQDARTRFVSRLARYLAEECNGFSHACDGTPVPRGLELRGAIEQLVETGKSFGLVTELGLGQFVVASLGYSREFHAIPQVADWLNDRRMSPDHNMQRVINAIVVAEDRGAH